MNSMIFYVSLLVSALATTFGASISTNTTMPTVSNNPEHCNCSERISPPSKASIGEGIVCGPGDGVWAPPVSFFPSVDQFCYSIEGVDISSGYSVSDTFLITLTSQGGNILGDDGKIICESL